jgi:ankyrin repeat/BTB/POZ domain-containing protein 1
MSSYPEEEDQHHGENNNATAAEERTTTLKHNIEKALAQEKQDIQAGRLKDENPLDKSHDFYLMCEAARRGDLRLAQEQITKGVNINARDEYDYTPLILASLCGHFELVQMLLEQGAKCERDTFQGERCLYNALNDRIRNLLLSYDYSKSTDPLQPLAAHITSLLTRDSPQTADIMLHTSDMSFQLHKFVLSARSPYFQKKLREKPETKSWKLAPKIATDSFETCIRYLYFGEASIRGQDTDAAETLVLEGVDKLSRQLEIPQVFDAILNPGDRRQARQRRQDEVERGRDQMQSWFREHVLQKQFQVDADKTNEVQWKRDNPSFADVLLLADVDDEEDDESSETAGATKISIPVGPSQATNSSALQKTLFPAHRAMLLRSELFATMFTSPFREGQISSATPSDDPTTTTSNETTDSSAPLQIIPVDCTPAVLSVILTFLYTETTSFPLSIALDVLHAADMLFIEKLKQRAALLISTLGNGASSIAESDNPRGNTPKPGSSTFSSEEHEQPLEWIYEVVRSGWDCRVHRLEEFGARYMAYRLESYIDDEEFKELVRESAARIKLRQETDTVEIVDDIRYYLSERFRLRFEDSGLGELMDENADRKRGGDDGNGSDDDNDGDDRDDSADNIDDEGYAGSPPGADTAPDMEGHAEGVVRTLDGEIAGDEFAQDAMNYQILLGKIDQLLEELTLEA